MNKFINVILPLPLEKEFTYSVTDIEAESLQPGMRVAVPFGKSKIYTGIVTAIHEKAPVIYQAKPIDQVLDSFPIVTENQLKFWKWIADYYMCTTGEVLKSALPGAFLLESETFIRLKNIPEDTDILLDDEFLILEALQQQSTLSIAEIINILNKKHILPTIQRLVSKNVVEILQEVNEQFKPKVIRYVRIHPSFSNEKLAHQLLDSLEKAPKQREVLLSFFSLSSRTKKPIKISELKKASGCSAAIIRSLASKEILEEFVLETDRLNTETLQKEEASVLNDEQEKALFDIRKNFREKPVCLLHGVTSSGKTEIYVHLIEEALEKGEQVLFLLPEIALTAQLIERLKRFFGNKVLVYHSRYNVQERVEIYKHILQHDEKGKIILGARSSIFLPFKNLGFVIVDEEHEVSYKQFEPAPRYNARDAAIVLGKLHNAKVLLGSATPSIESFHNAFSGKYSLVTLQKRHGNVLLPQVEIVDIKEKYRKKQMNGHFSDRLLEEIRTTLSQGEQVILFQNRRGYSPILECNQCGHTPQCPNCDVSLTYHSYSNKLRCHYCGYAKAKPINCLACGSVDISTKGFGTEQIEDELKTLFPENVIGRMDFDTTRGKFGYEKIISAFEQMEIDILVGTQMLTKGLDFRNVRLVGIMSADTLLNFPDFRAHERSFQLMLQVAGRAGRTKKRGLVLIQTYNPYHNIVQQVSTNDYPGMFKEQMEERRQYRYPPFFRMIKFVLKHRDFGKVDEASKWLAKSLRNSYGENILGPETPPISRIRNQYHINILMKIDQRQSLVRTKQNVSRILVTFNAISAYRSVKIVTNVDPY
ncbi:MAG TPA: primosomal protein N' [Salinimicrobium sp.]|nr:primosomal protein N' [Salinimicrobium sp.]